MCAIVVCIIVVLYFSNYQCVYKYVASLSPLHCAFSCLLYWPYVCTYVCMYVHAYVHTFIRVSYYVCVHTVHSYIHIYIRIFCQSWPPSVADNS